MPIPMEIQHATEDFERFLADACDVTNLTTRNQTYTTTQGVLFTFRRRLDVPSALRFADILPPVLRAIFVSDWNVNKPLVSFTDRAAMTLEVQSLRKNHNFSPDTCIRDIARALRKHVDERRFDEVLDSLPEGAKEFWQV